MAIYSANRTGRFSLAGVGINENYNENDIGQIMYESECNNMALFEAVMVNDLYEINAMREGTMLESESISFNRKSSIGFIQKLRERLEEWWMKIKNAFKTATRKILAYVFQDGKAFVKDFKAAEKKYGKLKSPLENMPWFSNSSSAKDFPNPNEVEQDIKSKKDGDLIKTADVVKEFLGGLTPSEYRSKVKEETFNDDKKTISQNEITQMLDIVENGKKSIDIIKSAEKSLEKRINEIGRRLKEAERDPETERSNDTTKNISALVSAYESIAGTIASSQIEISKGMVKLCRSNLAAVMNKMKENKSTSKNEATYILETEEILAAEDEVDTAFDAPIESEALDSDLKEAIDDAEVAIENESYYSYY